MTAQPLERDVARWGVALFALIVCFQRFAVPGTPVSLLVPIAAGWAAVGIHRGLLTVDRTRLLLWLAAAGATALVGPLQVILTHAPLLSINSWALMMLTAAPAVLRVTTPTRAAYQLFLTGVVRVCTWFAGLTIFFLVSQYAGLRYHDWFATLVPGPLQMPGYVYTYPIAWQSPIYRSNAWIGLEASWTAFLLGLGTLAALLSRARPWRVVWLLTAILCTFSGSGFQLIAAGVVAMILGRRVHLLRSYAAAGLALAAAGIFTPVGQSIFGRVTELGNDRSSTSLRAVQPYVELWPHWALDLPTVLLGRGAGASQRLADDTHITGLLAPTATKVFMDYGLVAGALLFFFLVAMMLYTPEPAIAVALGAALWTIQTPTAVFLMATAVMLSIWSPVRPTTVPFASRGTAPALALPHAVHLPKEQP